MVRAILTKRIKMLQFEWSGHSGLSRKIRAHGRGKHTRDGFKEPFCVSAGNVIHTPPEHKLPSSKDLFASFNVISTASRTVGGMKHIREE